MTTTCQIMKLNRFNVQALEQSVRYRLLRINERIRSKRSADKNADLSYIKICRKNTDQLLSRVRQIQTQEEYLECIGLYRSFTFEE